MSLLGQEGRDISLRNATPGYNLYSSKFGTSTKAPGLCPPTSPNRIHLPLLGLDKSTQHPQVQGQHYDLSSSPVAGHFPSWQVVSVPLSPQMAQKHLREATALGCPGLSRFQPMRLSKLTGFQGKKLTLPTLASILMTGGPCMGAGTRATRHLCRAPLTVFIWADQGGAGSQGA